MQSTNSEYGSPYLAECHVTFTFTFFTFSILAWMLHMFLSTIITQPLMMHCSALSEIVNICFLIGKRCHPAAGNIWRWGYVFLHVIWAIWTVSDSLVACCLCCFFVFVLQSLWLQIARGLLEEEAAEAEQEKQRYMDENCTVLSLPGNMQELQVHTNTHTHTHTHTHWLPCFMGMFLKDVMVFLLYKLYYLPP